MPRTLTYEGGGYLTQIFYATEPEISDLGKAQQSFPRGQKSQPKYRSVQQIQLARSTAVSGKSGAGRLLVLVAGDLSNAATSKSE